ncbi:MAG: hypothetical protein L0K38_13180 [Yaniella sp.]|uniref:hypothetical protein n=1 Tax=Yaniella sp. TaxID=2773929 RepID=UPI002649A86B|nr:hypothetical protein [Yaniella sp.]MDN6457974.1 hypothetical protein [Yaniella sp.]
MTDRQENNRDNPEAFDHDGIVSDPLTETNETELSVPPPAFEGDENDKSLERYRKSLMSSDYFEHLNAATRNYLSRDMFHEGDVVKWKEFLKEALFPDYGAPATFIRYLTDEDRKGLIPAYRSESDCLIGVLDGDSDFIVFDVQSSRLMNWANSPSKNSR